MPRGNRTGPEGRGPMTGRAMGFCAGYNEPGYTSNAPAMGYGRGMGRGFRGGFGRGFGRGLGRGFGPGIGYNYPMEYEANFTPTKEEEMNMLKDQAARLKRSLNDIQKRIEELEKEED